MSTSTLRSGRAMDQLLQALLARLTEDLKGDPLQRMERAEADLGRCVEAIRAGDGSPASALLLALPCFLEEKEWQGTDDEDRRVRMRLVLELARQIRRLPTPDGFDTVAATSQLDRAWRSALQRLRDDQGQRGSV